MPAAGAVAMFQSLADFVVEVYEGDDEMMNAVLEAAHEGLQQRGHVADASAESSLLALLQRPLKVSHQCTYYITLEELKLHPKSLHVLNATRCSSGSFVYLKCAA